MNRPQKNKNCNHVKHIVDGKHTQEKSQKPWKKYGKLGANF